MQGRTTAAQPVLSQRVERQPVSRVGYFANLFVCRLGRIMRQEWMPVNARAESAVHKDAFEAVKHEHRILNQPSAIREEDSTTISANIKGSPSERHHGPRGRLLSFKKPK
jgi:hypothetical protein